jgi:hypothetical protein
MRRIRSRRGKKRRRRRKEEEKVDLTHPNLHPAHPISLH